jgi:Ca2+-binding EF-hand superfamily protein
VARGETKLYLFHTKKARWVIGRQMDDGSRCYAFLPDDGGTSQTPVDCQHSGAKWQTGGHDGRWIEDGGMRSDLTEPARDAFTKLRASLEDEMQRCGLTEPSKLKALWKKMDKDGNGEIEFSEMESLTKELVKSGVWPAWMDYQEALDQAFQRTLEDSEDGDNAVQQEEFHDLLLNMFWFCKLHEIFQEIETGGDGHIQLEEFQAGMRMLELEMSDQQMSKEFNEIDKDHNGLDFSEFVLWVRSKVSPEHNHSFDDDKSHASKLAKKAASNPEATTGVVMRKKNFSDFDALEKKIKGLCSEGGNKGIQKLWKRLDFNGNNVVSLAEIDKWVVEVWPLLNHKPALMRAFKATIEAGHDADEFVHKKDFKLLIVNIFYFNKLFWMFDQVDKDHDRRMDFEEFQWCMSMCGCKLSKRKMETEFRKVDTNGGGEILFDEFCMYFTQKQCPEGAQTFLADE